MELITIERGEAQLLNNQYLDNKNKTGDSSNTYWESKKRRSDNGCGVRITLDQQKVF